MKRLYVLLPAPLFGIWLSLVYINPYGGQITLSELVLQLSGSRGSFPLGLSLTDLLTFSLRLVPTFVFEALAGVTLYRHWCTASVYVFSRIPGRRGWYLSQVSGLLLTAALYQVLLLAAALCTALLRWEVLFDLRGALYLGFHFGIYTLWTAGAALLVNLIAIFTGSSAAFTGLTAAQLVLISLFALLREPVYELLRLNPMSCLVLGWQGSRLLGDVAAMRIENSLIISAILALAALVAGVVIVQRHDLIVSDMESGG